MAAVSRYGPPLAMMGLIFFLSAQPDLNSGLGAWDLLLRKLAHMTEYTLLFILWRRALPDASAWSAAAIAVAYAVTDEFHQTFVDGRDGTPLDVLVDTAGVGVGWLTWDRLMLRRAG
jgi:VanZ family protein